MPPGRRKSAGTSRSTPTIAAQSILSFNSKSARVTKPSVNDASNKKTASKTSEAALTEAVNESQAETVELEPAVIEVPIRHQAKAAVVKDEVEKKAEKVSDSQLKKYWKAEEDMRLAPRGKFDTRTFQLGNQHI